jgi:hypothetical protein
MQVRNYYTALLASLLVFMGGWGLFSLPYESNTNQSTHFVVSSETNFSAVYSYASSEDNKVQHLFSYRAHQPLSVPFQAESCEFDVEEKYASNENLVVEFTVTEINFSAIHFLYESRLNVLLEFVNSLFYQKSTPFLVILYHTWKIFPSLIAPNI